ncbi:MULTISPECIES: hypothetical protein [Bradyrhizobium]|uniref:hypothetical protein n=1 Tax=Bradyrhizobium TaxID=374 RepID=UPI00103A8843|nr:MULTISPECIES: hypothetical protein [Bradyrhizobium]MBR1362891.1 hypothetical protein [Bradyrhizobium ottawaense]WQN79965.1 hypothetical protein U7859_23445 [Bradyrhizobium ottawaense]GMO19321.1 hypothetical protein BwSH14_12100 [Bradyrhizobium ottawaense]GMO30599.1 hypothetical protein BwSF21_32310 [Bradyrhizobium ottawaense]GMO41045.1 hypothetical protein BwSF12_43900 [Bradyrhizobium ottawaense]
MPTVQQAPTVSSLVEAAFSIASVKYRLEHAAWTDFSARLAGRVSVVPMMVNLQRIGSLDLTLRAMEDEALAAANEGTPAAGGFAFHYQMTFSETWTVAAYEALRAVRQRETEAANAARRKGSTPAPDDVSSLADFKQVFADLELLRVPMAKYELAGERKMKSALTMQAFPPNGNDSDTSVYDKDDPTRTHIMPSGLSARWSVMWQVLDHSGPKAYWVERRDLADRLLALKDQVEPAGIREARLAAESAQPEAGL